MYLTRNDRLASFLSYKKLSPVLPLDVWVATVWSTLHNQYPNRYPKMLTEVEQERVWEHIIIQSAKTEYPLLRTAATARLACEAWQLYQQWEITPYAGVVSADIQCYQKWEHTYRAECIRWHWTDTACVLGKLTELIKKGEWCPPESLTLVGFEEWTPQQSRFFEACREKGASIAQSSLISSTKGNAYQLPTASTEEELQLAISVAKDWLSDDPSARIGIVVPDLEQRRFEVARVLGEQLSQSCFNIIAPASLLEYPLIQSTLVGLRLMCSEFSFETASQFLRLPFFGEALREMSERAILEVHVRMTSNTRFSYESFRRMLERGMVELPAENAARHLLKIVRAGAALHPIFRNRCSAKVWKARCSEWLDALEWPGARILNEEEVQLKADWSAALEEYARLDALLGDHSCEEAIESIQRLVSAKKCLVMPGSVENTPIQVLGVLDALGLPFDYLWIMGLHQENWPTQPVPNPYIPFSLQHAMQVPRSAAEREFKVAERITRQFVQSAGKVVLSYSEQLEDRRIRPSCVLAALPHLKLDRVSMGKTRSIVEAFDQPRAVNRMPVGGEQGPPLPENGLVPGGAQVLKLQAECPFRAFSKIRLGARSLPVATQVGLTVGDRGTVLHQCLHLFWTDLKDQAALNALTEKARLARIVRVIETVFKQWMLKDASVLTPHYSVLEQKRVERLMQRFIQLEQSRPPFEVVATEVEQTIFLGGVFLKLKIDRIDKVHTGEELLLDYKTGQVSLSEWFDERLSDPQLPLYCIARRPYPSGIAFAIIRPDAVKFQGVAEREDYLPGIQLPRTAERFGSVATWTEQCVVWEKKLATLAEEFRTGVASVEPIEGEKTCRNCSLQALCRVEHG